MIPNYEIERKLMDHGINPTSAISHIKAGISTPGYSHILSFRRQLYVKPEDFDKLPSSFQLHYDDTNYWIYVSSDTPICFVCKVEGHLARQCNTATSKQTDELAKSVSNSSEFPPLSINSSDQQEPLQPEPLVSNLSPPSHLPIDLSISPHQTDDPNITDSSQVNKPLAINDPIELHTPPKDLSTETKHHNKRPISSTNSETSQKTIIEPHSSRDRPMRQGESSDEDGDANTTIKPIAKKIKSSDKMAPMCESLAAIKPRMEENPNEYILNFTQLTSFYENTIGANDVIKVALNYTDDLMGLAETLRKLYPYLSGNSVKNRTTRLEKKLLAALGQQRNLPTNRTSDVTNEK